MLRNILAALGSVGRILATASRSVFLAFNPSTVTFTPGMAKRLPPAGPFAAALVVQGKAADSSLSDSVIISRGTQVSGNFYSNFDSTQGTINLWLTPEGQAMMVSIITSVNGLPMAILPRTPATI